MSSRQHPTPAGLLPGRTRNATGLLATSGLSSPVLASPYIHTTRSVLPARTEISTIVERACRVWNVCGLIMGKLTKVIRVVSTLSAALVSVKTRQGFYTQLHGQLTALVSTINRASFATVKSLDMHSIHLAYNYNYLYIKRSM